MNRKLTPGMMRILALVAALSLATAAQAAEDAANAREAIVVKALSDYLDFAEYGDSLIRPGQFTADEWKRVLIVDTRDAAQYQRGHIPGAVNIEWRQVVARRNELAKDRPVGMYCNSGSLSAQAVFALRLLGMENVQVLQDGLVGWKAKGGFAASAVGRD